MSMKSEQAERKITLLAMQAHALEQANSGLRSRCKALQHILAHQGIMAELQQQMNSKGNSWDEGSMAADSEQHTQAINSTVTQELLQEEILHNPLLQSLHNSPDLSAYLSVRDSSAADLGQAWLLLLSTLSLALHVHDMTPQLPHSKEMLCKAVTDCNRFIAAVNLLQEEAWSQLWYLNLLTGAREVPSSQHWQAAMAAAAPTAAQLQEARAVLAVTSSKLQPVAEAVERQLQQVSSLINNQPQQQAGASAAPQHWQHQQQALVMPCSGRQEDTQQETTAAAPGLDLELSVYEPAHSDCGDAAPPGPLHFVAPGFVAPPAFAAAAGRQQPPSTAAMAADRPSSPTACCTATMSRAQHSSSSSACGSGLTTYSGHFLQVLSSLESREEALAALSSSMSSWRVLRMMVGSLIFLLRPDQLARLYLHSLPYMPIGCMLHDQIDNPDQSTHETTSSC